jgi:hypothetical protein
MVAGTPNEVINVRSVEDLRREETRIVERINATPNGGKLFAVDPLRLLAEIGVAMQTDARRKVELELGLEGGSPTASAYDSIRLGRADASIRVVVKGILRRGP